MSEQIRQDGVEGEDPVVAVNDARIEDTAKEPAETPARDVAGDDDYAKKDATSNGGADSAREVEIGKEWDDGAENKDAAEREIEEPAGVPGAPAHAAVAPGAPTVDGHPMMSGAKRRRDEDDTVQGPELKPPGIIHPPNYAQFQQPKRPRQDCFRCGGSGHIAVMCVSEHDAKLNTALSVCRTCGGRGHMSRDCPNNIPPGVCYRCRREGHRGRDCPMTQMNGMNMYAAPAPQAAVGGANAAAMAYGAMPGAYYDPVYGREYDPYGYARPMYAEHPVMAAPRPRFAVGSGRCFRCNEPGHWTRDCPYRPQDGDPNGCYKCGRSGHMAKNCDVCFKCKGFGHNPFECTADPRIAH